MVSDLEGPAMECRAVTLTVHRSLFQQIHAITLAARTVKNSKRMSQLLELILLFGNMMNGAKRGHAYGFKLQSLDILAETKTADKKMSLLHYIMEFKDEFPDIVGIDQELRAVEKAAQVPLENLIGDQVELEKGMDRCRKESALRKDNLVLKEFLVQNEDKLQKLLTDVNIAKEAYAACVEYFGESARTVPSNTFFSTLHRFLKNAKQADQENERRRVLG